MKNLPHGAGYWDSDLAHGKNHFSFEQPRFLKEAAYLISKVETRILPRSTSVKVRLAKGHQSASSSAVRCLDPPHLHRARVLPHASRSDFLHSSGKEPQFTPAACQNSENTQPHPGTSVFEEGSLILELAESGNQPQAVQG